VQTDGVIEAEHLLGTNPEPGAGAVVVIVGEGNDGIESIVAAGELE
jgi:hypothetical protein